MEGTVLTFKTYVHPLVMVSYFLYLGQTLMVMDNDCLEVVGNLFKARRTWESLSQILGWEKTYMWTSGKSYFTVVQANASIQVVNVGSESPCGE